MNQNSGEKRSARFEMILRLGLALVAALCILYLIFWFLNGQTVQKQNEEIGSLYVRSTRQAEAPTPAPSSAHTAPAAAPSETPGASPAADSAKPPSPTPLATPDSNTLIISLPTPPPAQESFAELLLYNPDTVGYLEIGDGISLPVLWRENDNEYYLTHNFAGEESAEGALFLDGVNRLTADDPLWIVYGHNMKDGTMLAKLSLYGSLEYLKAHPLAHFDTIYENGVYAPFAMFQASADRDSRAFFDVRRLTLQEDTFDFFIGQLRDRSVVKVPVDVRWGDQVLLLVTCSYGEADGRFIVALREMREDESETSLTQAVKEASFN